MTGFKKNRTDLGALEVDEKAPAWAQSIKDAVMKLADAHNAADDEIAKLNGGLRLGGNSVGVLKRLSFATPSEPPWKDLNATGAWSNYGSGNVGLQYLMSPGGRVELRGLVTGGNAASTIATLPTGYQPGGTADMSWVQEASAPTAPGYIRIGGTSNPGRIYYAAGPSPCNTVSLDGICYFAGAPAAPPHQFSGNGWPLKVQHGFERCVGLMPLGAVLDEQGAGVGLGSLEIDWQDSGDGNLRINGVWGLQWGRRYILNVFLTPEGA